MWEPLLGLVSTQLAMKVFAFIVLYIILILISFALYVNQPGISTSTVLLQERREQQLLQIEQFAERPQQVWQPMMQLIFKTTIQLVVPELVSLNHRFRRNHEGVTMNTKQSEQHNFKVENAVLHDARVVHDTAGFKFNQYEDGGVPSWIVGLISPEPDSGSATTPGQYLDIDTGSIITPLKAETVIIKKGKWLLIDSAIPEKIDSGVYSWNEPLLIEKRILTTEDFYSPFSFGGTIIFKPNPSLQGIGYFGFLQLISPGWIKTIKNDSEYSKKFYNILNEYTDVNDDDKKTLLKLTISDNSFLAVMAFRKLIKAQVLTTQNLTKCIIETKGYKLAVFTYHILNVSESSETEKLTQSIITIIPKIQSLNEIRNIALGAFTFALFENNKSQQVLNAKSILSELKKQTKNMGVTIKHDAKLFIMFEKMAI